MNLWKTGTLRILSICIILLTVGLLVMTVCVKRNPRGQACMPCPSAADKRGDGVRTELSRLAHRGYMPTATPKPEPGGQGGGDGGVTDQRGKGLAVPFRPGRCSASAPDRGTTQYTVKAEEAQLDDLARKGTPMTLAPAQPELLDPRAPAAKRPSGDTAASIRGYMRIRSSSGAPDKKRSPVEKETLPLNADIGGRSGDTTRSPVTPTQTAAPPDFVRDQIRGKKDGRTVPPVTLKPPATPAPAKPGKAPERGEARRVDELAEEFREANAVAKGGQARGERSRFRTLEMPDPRDKGNTRTDKLSSAADSPRKATYGWRYQNQVDRYYEQLRAGRPALRTGKDLTRMLSNALASGEELWVIAKMPGKGKKARVIPAKHYKTDEPGSGELQAKMPGKEKRIPLPLKHTDVTATVSGYVATVNVKQQYHNPYGEKIEAVYVFPLPQNAAVNEFIMTVGKRRIRGIIREREEAKRIYQAAKRRGHVASLLEQQRPNIFTQKVANIEPGKAIDIDIRYFNTLIYTEGVYEFVFPMVVGPRFNPPGSKNGVGAVAWGTHGASGQKTEVHYLRPEQRSGHDIALKIDIDAGVPIEKVWSPSHAVECKAVSDRRTTVQLTAHDRIPNKDFVLKYRVAGKTVKGALMVQRKGTGGFFTLLLQPPTDIKLLEESPMEMIFVLDCSGSMSGEPIRVAKEAIERALKRLRPQDTFQLIRFSKSASQFGSKPILATAENVEQALRYLRKLHGCGGTRMIEGIKAALDFPHDETRFRMVSFMTDGFIGNEDQILQAVHQRLGASRIFSFGVGSSPNWFLLDRMALLGQGAVARVGLDGESGLEAVDRYYARIRHPALTDIEIDWGEMGVTDVYPTRIPDLFAGRPVILTGRFSGSGETVVRVRGKVAGKTRELALPVNLTTSEQHPGIPLVWARTRIAELRNRLVCTGDAKWSGQIKQVALTHGLVSDYTSFIAVDTLTKTQGSYGVTVNVPVPHGVRYDTTVTE